MDNPLREQGAAPPPRGAAAPVCESEDDLDDVLDFYRSTYRRVVGYFDDYHGAIVFKKAPRPELQRFVDVAARSADDEDASLCAAAENLATACCVSHPPEKIREIFDDLPGLPLDASKEIQEISKASGRARRGKSKRR